MKRINLSLICLISIFFAILLGGCGAGDTALKGQKISFTNDADYIKYLDNRLNSLKTFQGSGKFKITNSKKSDSATCALLIKKPDSIRLESFSLFGDAVFYFASKKDTFSIFIPKENRFFTGENTVKNIKKVLPIDVPIDEFSDYLIGNFSRGDDDNVVIKFLEDQHVYKVYYYGKEHKVLWLDPETLTITKCTIADVDDNYKATVNYSAFKEIDGMVFPMKISINFPDLDAEIDASYDDISVNTEMQDTLFTLEAPEKAEIINLSQRRIFDK